MAPSPQIRTSHDYDDEPAVIGRRRGQLHSVDISRLVQFAIPVYHRPLAIDQLICL